MQENLANHSPRARCLGLIGGLGVGATIHYYRELTKAHEAAGTPLRLLLAHADMRRVFRHVEAGDPGGLASYMAGLIANLRDGGADVAAISAVMPHLCVRELIALSPLPIVNLLEAVRAEIFARRFQRVALFGTRFTMESNLFGQLAGVDVIQPKREELEYIHNTYFQLASDGKSPEQHFAGLTNLAQELSKRDGVDGIVLAGTDFSVLFNESNTDFPHVDCSRAHIRAILRTLGG